jgi:hypothetical protein
MESQAIETLLSLLKKGNATVNFTKMNGEKRVMTCTLNHDIISKMMDIEVITEEIGGNDVIEKDHVVVYEIGVGWRGFKPSTVSSFKRG